MVLLILRNYHIDKVCNISGFDLTFQKLFLSLGDKEFFFFRLPKTVWKLSDVHLVREDFYKKKELY